MDNKCRNCRCEIIPPEGLPEESVLISNKSLEIVNKFCYLGDMISVTGGVEESIVARIRCGWKKPLPLLTWKAFSLCTKDVFLYGCKSVIWQWKKTAWQSWREMTWWWYAGCVMWHWRIESRLMSWDHLELVNIRNYIQGIRIRIYLSTVPTMPWIELAGHKVIQKLERWDSVLLVFHYLKRLPSKIQKSFVIHYIRVNSTLECNYNNLFFLVTIFIWWLWQNYK